MKSKKSKKAVEATGGEWEASGGSVVTKIEGRVVVIAFGDMRDIPTQAQRESNARLIAQSPSLLTALINLLEHREGTVEGNAARKEAELLIQKIRGHE